MRRLYTVALACGALLLSNLLAAQSNTESCTEATDVQHLFETVSSERLGEWVSDFDGVQGLQLEPEVFADLRAFKYNSMQLALPLPGNQTVVLDAELFVPWSTDFTFGTTLPGGQFKEENYTPQLLCYRLRGAEIKGTMILMENYVMGTFIYQKRQYEISTIREGEMGLHVIVPVDAGVHPSGFVCGVEDTASELQPGRFSEAASGGGCVEMAIDIDFFTFEAFGSDCPAAIEWTLALLAGVNDIYVADLDDLINIQATYIHVWQDEDPYAEYVEEANDMLNGLRQEWLNNDNFSVIDRDLVHLLTRRTNTGTGGIAYLDVNCSNNWGTAFSSYLSPQTSYNLSNYAWNLDVVAHELGHNFGSPHTHWCGWSNGTIDNCAEAEGDCTNDVQAQLGTIMSYCHAIAGGSKVLELHPVVIDEALIPAISTWGDCYTNCEELTTSCLYYGCTDPTACNFEPEAAADDNSCTYGTDCSDPTACNFDPDSVCEGPCNYTNGCTDPEACNFNQAAGCDDGSCIMPNGCTDPLACNFVANASCDDGSCAYISHFNVLGPTIAMNSEAYTYIYANNEGSTYQWSVTGGDLVSGQGSNTVEVIWDPGAGTTSICVIEENSDGCEGDEICLSVDVLTVGVDDAVQNLFVIFPNPGNGIYNLELNEKQVGQQLQVFDAQGRLIEEHTLTNLRYVLDLRGQANGKYFLMIQGNQPAVQQVIKQ